MQYILVLLTVVFCIALSFRKKTYDYWSKESTSSIRGIMALLIVVHHVALTRPDGNVLLGVFYSKGYLFVAFFFLLSGYGLMYQLKNRGSSYMDGFLIKRLSKLFVPYVFAIITFFIFKTVFLKYNITLPYVFESLFKNGAPAIVPYSWYVILIFLFYIIFYFIFKPLKSNLTAGSIIMLAVTCIYITLGIFSNYPIYWYMTCISFPVGIFWALYLEKIDGFFKKYYRFVFPTVLAIFEILLLTSDSILNFANRNKAVEIVLISVRSLLFAISVILAGYKIKFSCKPLNFLGKISFEIYLFQGLAINLFSNGIFRIENDIILLAVSLAVTVAVSWLFNLADSYLINRLFAGKSK